MIIRLLQGEVMTLGKLGTIRYRNNRMERLALAGEWGAGPKPGAANTQWVPYETLSLTNFLNAVKLTGAFDQTQPLVIIESPYGSPDDLVVEENLRYLRACGSDCFARGEAYFASHGLYTQKGVLDDRDPEERKKGLLAGFAWGMVASKVAVYTDRGVTPGMIKGIAIAQSRGLTIENRTLKDWK